jgi:tetratricopeptide (TPR) repeat protein
VLAFYGMKPAEELLPKAMEAATKALAIDDESAEAHTALAVTALQSWDFVTAESEFRRAIELDPGYSLARYWYGFHCLQLIHGRVDEGIEQCRLGLEADPLGTLPQAMVGIALTIGGRYDEAAPHLERSVARDPSNFFIHRTVGTVDLTSSGLHRPGGRGTVGSKRESPDTDVIGAGRRLHETQQQDSLRTARTAA